MLFDDQGMQTVQETAGGHGPAEVMVLAGPEFPDAGDGFGQLLIQGLPALFDRGGRKISRVADLTVEQGLRGLIVGQWRLHAARQRGDAVCAFPHEREERIQAGDAA
jgi:hypothetical protein